MLEEAMDEDWVVEGLRVGTARVSLGFTGI